MKPWDTASFKRAVSSPERFLKQSTLEQIEYLATQTNNYLKAVEYFVENYQRHLFHPDRSELKKFANLFRSIQAMIDSEVIQYLSNNLYCYILIINANFIIRRMYQKYSCLFLKRPVIIIISSKFHLEIIRWSGRTWMSSFQFPRQELILLSKREKVVPPFLLNTMSTVSINNNKACETCS